MHLLHQALDSDPLLQQVARGLSERIAGNPLKHAIVLDLNPFWLTCYRLNEAGLNDELLNHFGAIYPHQMPGTGGGYVDLSTDFKRATNATLIVFGNRKYPQSPYLLKIFARPSPDRASLEQRQQLVNAARETAIATIVETQEPAQLLAAPGDRVISGTGNPGTVGGFFRDSGTGKTFGVTCGHVVSGGSASISGHPYTCAHAAVPLTLPAGTVCTTSCGHLTTLDVALLDVTASTPTNVASSIASILAPGDLVSMHGASSGHRHYEIGGAVVEHSIGGACWDRLVLFHAQVTGGVLPIGLRITATPPPARGDSGAWLIRNSNEWAGMVVAANALHGYALAGDTILSQSDALFGTRLGLA